MSPVQEFANISPQARRVERRYQLEQDILYAIQELSMQYACSEDTVVETLLRFAVAQTRALLEYSRLWDNLSHREKEIITLACLDHTNREIACRLGISPETVKSHLYNALSKLHIKGRKQLISTLANWRFSDWNKGPTTNAG